MHELSIAQSIAEIVNQYAPAGKKRGIRSVKLKIGDLAGVLPESLSFCFAAVIEGTLAEGAELQIENVPIVCRCNQCGFNFEVGHYVFLCPTCGNPYVEVICGQELDVAEIELNDD